MSQSILLELIMDAKILDAILVLISVAEVVTPNPCTGNTDIMFEEQPENTKVCPNRPAYFNCRYNGTVAQPHWKINSNAYASSNLPFNTKYDADNDTLIVNNVTVDQNNDTYQCYFTVAKPGIQPCDVLSTVARLELYSMAQGVCICEDDQDRFCSCFQDNVILALSSHSSLISSEEFIILVFCHYPVNLNVELKIEVNSEFGPEDTHLLLCDNEIHSLSNTLRCRNTSNRSVSYNVSAYISSFEEQTFYTPCSVKSITIEMISPRCAGGSDKKTVDIRSCNIIILLTLALAAFIN